MDFMEEIFAERIGGTEFGKATELYKFAKIKAARERAQKENPYIKLIDMGVGEPDLPASYEIVEVLNNEAGKSENRFYADNGIGCFQEAAANFMKQFYGVDLNKEGLTPTEAIVHSIGSKPALALLPLCLINPGDIALVTVPGYPILGTYTKYLGGEVYPLPLVKENDFYPDFNEIPQEVLKRAKLLYINYPNNPTGQIATEDFYKRVVAFAKENHIVVVVDAAYAEIAYEPKDTISFLSIEGAFEVGVELHSLSKAFNMTGWRLGFLVGNPKLISAFKTVKDNTDSGQFRAIQKAGAYALSNMELINQNKVRYARRMKHLVTVLKEAGFKVEAPKATFYCYTPAFKSSADRESFKTAEQCSEYLIEKALISTVPWDDAGAYLRFSVTFDAKDKKEEIEVIEEVGRRLKDLKLKF